MYKSYFFLNRLVLELQSLLIEKTIISCFSQEKDKLIIQTNSDEVWIEVSVNHNEPFINIKSKYSRARKNTIDLFETLNNAKIINILIADNDRIIKLQTSKGDLYFAIRGKFTNLYFIQEHIITSFKLEEVEILNNTLKEFDTRNFIDFFNKVEFTGLQNLAIKEIRDKYKFIGREIENEVIARKTIINDKNDYELLKSVINDIETDNPVVFINEKNNEVRIAFNSFIIYNDFNKEKFEDLVTAFNHYLIKKYQFAEKLSKQKILESFLDKELKKVANKLNNLLAVISTGSKEEEYNKMANLLLINLNNQNFSSNEIEVDDIYETIIPANKIKIKLDEKLSLQKNATKYFDKARDNKLAFEKSGKLYRESKLKFELLKTYKDELNNIISIDRIKTIMKELKLKDGTEKHSEYNDSIKFKHYLIENIYHVFVGKDSQNNDLLTVKFAKQNDFWFHARSVSGSHVVLRVENTKEVIPKSVLKKAASLAAYHSKAKTAGVVPVSYTLKKYVIKKKGAPVGQVSLLKEEVLLVKPEIPVDAEYLTE